VVVGLGAIGARAATAALLGAGYRFERKPVFAHGAEAVALRDVAPSRVVLLHSYHPSRQNTNTGVLTEPMFDAIFERAKGLLGAPEFLD
jgi:uracil-DNA glycosylase